MHVKVKQAFRIDREFSLSVDEPIATVLIKPFEDNDKGSFKVNVHGHFFWSVGVGPGDHENLN